MGIGLKLSAEHSRIRYRLPQWLLSLFQSLIIPLYSRAPPGLPRAFSAQGISKSIIFKPWVTELLMLCLLIISDLTITRSRQMQLQMLCFVGLWKRPLDFHVSKPCSHVFELCAFEPHVSEPCFYVYKRFSLGSTLSELHDSESRLHVSAPRSHIFEHHVFGPCAFESLFGPHFFGPHPIGSLHFFDSTRSSFAEHLSCLSHISCETRFEAI